MDISFAKIKQNPLNINYTKDDFSLIGVLERIDRDCIKLKTIFSVSIEVVCNRCGKDFLIDTKYPLELILSDGRYNSTKNIDVVEFFDNRVDFDYIIESEIASIKGDYNLCDSCKDSDEILEIEF